MHGYSHGQPQVLVPIDPDQVAYNDAVDEAFQLYVTYAAFVDKQIFGTDEAERKARLHKLNRKVYVEDVEKARARYGQREYNALIV